MPCVFSRRGRSRNPRRQCPSGPSSFLSIKPSLLAVISKSYEYSPKYQHEYGELESRGALSPCFLDLLNLFLLVTSYTEKSGEVGHLSGSIG